MHAKKQSYLGILCASILCLPLRMQAVEWYAPIEGVIPGWEQHAASAAGSVVQLGETGAKVPAEALLRTASEKRSMPRTQLGVYLTPTSLGNTSFRQHTIEELKASGGNTIVFDVKGHGVHFNAESSELALKLGLVHGTYNLQEILNILREEGIYTVARFIAIKDYALTDILPNTELKHPRTGASMSPGWIDPENPVALTYNKQIICELAAAGVGEINLDYIRYSTERMEPLSVFPGEERIKRIETFLQMARTTIDSCGKDTKLGISTFAILAWDAKSNAQTLGQDIVRFAPLVDAISPMAYNANFSTSKYDDPTGRTSRWYYLVYKTVRGYREILGEEHAWKVRPWIQGWSANEEQLRQQMQGVFHAGGCGFMVWNAGNRYGESYNAMADVRIPVHCLEADDEPELLVLNARN